MFSVYTGFNPTAFKRIIERLTLDCWRKCFIKYNREIRRLHFNFSSPQINNYTNYTFHTYIPINGTALTRSYIHVHVY